MNSAIKFTILVRQRNRTMRRQKLINVNEITELVGVNRTYFSPKIVPNTNFLEIARPIRLYGNGAPKYHLKDVLKFIESRKEVTVLAS